MRATSSLAIALAAAVACTETTAPTGPTRSIDLTLCAGTVPGSWFAYRNDGGAWTRIAPNGAGHIVFDATEKVSVASVVQIGGLTITQILNATATELEATPAAACDAELGNQSITGTVSGLGSEDFVRISAGGYGSDGASQANPEWELDEVPTHAVDLVATRYATFSSQPAQEVIVRRGLLAGNAAIPTLDFASAEAVPIESAVATFTGIPANGSLNMLTAVNTANGTIHELGDLAGSPPTGSTQAVSYASLPASLRLATDIHILTASAYNTEGTLTLQAWYKTPSARTLAFGPMLSDPVITNSSITPVVRPRLQLAAQAEYPSAVEVSFGEPAGQAGSRYVSIVTTAGFVGGAPATWDLEVPDMSSADYDADWALHTTTYNWTASAYGINNSDGFFSRTLTDGTLVISATRARDEASGARLAAARRLLPLSLVRRGGP